MHSGHYWRPNPHLYCSKMLKYRNIKYNRTHYKTTKQLCSVATPQPLFFLKMYLLKFPFLLKCNSTERNPRNRKKISEETRIIFIDVCSQHDTTR